MSKFNASVSVLGIQEVKTQQAILKLLENSLWNRETADSNRNELKESIRRLSQRLSNNSVHETNSFPIYDRHITDDTPFEMCDLVSVSTANYNVQVAFKNTSAIVRQCKVNGEAVEVIGNTTTRSPIFTVAGNGSFTLDNYDETIDMIIHIWR